jgi:Ca2+-binding RTX toxin-like protein
VLYGGTGADLLDGGSGRNTLTGGADADVFVFSQTSTTRIRDFEDGVDRLRIEADLPVRFEDLAIASFGTSDQHTRIVYESIVIELLNVSRALLDASDLELGVA